MELELDRAPVPEGHFVMGCDAGRDDERPAHRVYTDAFEMALTPVTNRAYRGFLSATGAKAPEFIEEPAFCHAEQPVVGVNWDEARAYCDWLSERSRLPLRLPTEAEREKAARGGVEGKLFPWGDARDGGGHEELEGPLAGPARVGTGRPNAYGIYHLADMVHEWCLDAYRSDYYLHSPSENPCAFGTDRRAARGGSWRHHVVVTPSAARSSLPPAFHYADFGFRWVRTLD